MSDSLKSFADNFNSSADRGLYYTIDVFLESFLYGFLTVATFAALRILSKQSTSSTRNLSIIIIVQWIVKTIASIVGLISICSFYSSTRYVIEHDELVLQSNAVIGKSRRLFSGSTDILWTINEVLALLAVIWRVYSLYPHNWTVKILLGFLWLGDAGLQFAIEGEYFAGKKQGITTAYTIHGSVRNITYITTSVVGLTICLVGTVLVGVRALQLRSLQQDFHRNTSSVGAKVRRVLYTLVEWGVVLCAVYTYRAIYLLVGTTSAHINTPYIIQKLVYDISLLVITAHPALIALVLSRGRSLAGNSTFGPRKTLAAIQFASQQPNCEDPEIGEREGSVP